MNANSAGSVFYRLLLSCSLFVGLATTASAATYGTAPAMSGVKELLVESVRMGSSELGGEKDNSCLLARGEVDTTFLKMLKAVGLPAFSAVEAKPQKIGIARIEVIPEIVTISAQGTECSTWIAITAQTHSTVRVPPVETPRNVVVTYWRGGLLINNAVTVQTRAVLDTLEKLVRQLADQYRLDQPPALPTFDDDDKTSK